MPDIREQAFSVSNVQHRVMGRQIRLQLADDYVLRLTPAEASSLSFALVAVHAGISPEREIYMSPIASDDAFDSKVVENGMRIALRDKEVELDWEAVGHLANAIAKEIG